MALHIGDRAPPLQLYQSLGSTSGRLTVQLGGTSEQAAADCGKGMESSSVSYWDRRAAGGSARSAIGGHLWRA
jgi:hypothetical protein